jgi:hypothetical protein
MRLSTNAKSNVRQGWRATLILKLDVMERWTAAGITCMYISSKSCQQGRNKEASIVKESGPAKCLSAVARHRLFHPAFFLRWLCTYFFPYCVLPVKEISR